MARRSSSALVLAVLWSCGKEQGTLEITTGAETDVFTRDPKPTRVVVQAYATDGTSTTLGEARLPAPVTVDLAEQKKTMVATIRVTARDDGDKILASGSSLLVELGALANHTLQIFVQRNGELARMPCGMSTREDPKLSILAGRYVLVVGGTDSSIASTPELCDLMSLASSSLTADASRTFPNFVPQSLVPYSTFEILIRQEGAKRWNFTNSSVSDVTAPDNGTFAEVAGGPTFEGASGTQYVVGPASDKVLVTKNDGSLAFARLSTPRMKAAATYVPGRGLVVIGGGGGVDQIAPESTTSTPLAAFPIDMRTGVAASLDGNRVVVAGTGVPALYDLGCVANCMPAPFGSDPGVPILEMFSVDNESVLAIGRATDGATRVFRIRKDASVEVPLKEPRRNARGVKLPTGAIAIVGGAKTIESFVP